MSNKDSKDQPALQNDAFPRREEFQKYLEKAGVIDQMTRLLVNLYENPEKPDNALDYMRTFLGASPAQDGDSIKLANRVEELEKQLSEKDNEIAALKREIEELRQSQDTEQTSEQSPNDDN